MVKDEDTKKGRNFLCTQLKWKENTIGQKATVHLLFIYNPHDKPKRGDFKNKHQSFWLSTRVFIKSPTVDLLLKNYQLEIKIPHPRPPNIGLTKNLSKIIFIHCSQIQKLKLRWPLVQLFCVWQELVHSLLTQSFITYSGLKYFYPLLCFEPKCLLLCEILRKRDFWTHCCFWQSCNSVIIVVNMAKRCI